MHGPRPFSCRRRPQIRHYQSAAQPQPHHLFRPSKTTVAKRILVDGQLRRRHRPLALISLHTPTVTIESPARDTPPRPRARQPSTDLLRPPLVAGVISHRDFCLQFFSLPCPPLALTHRNIVPRRSSSPTITRHFTPPSVCPDRDDISPPHARLDDIDDKGGNMGNQGDRQPPRYRLTGRLPIQSGRFRHTRDSQSPPRARCSAPALGYPTHRCAPSDIPYLRQNRHDTSWQVWLPGLQVVLGSSDGGPFRAFLSPRDAVLATLGHRGKRLGRVGLRTGNRIVGDGRGRPDWAAKYRSVTFHI